MISIDFNNLIQSDASLVSYFGDRIIAEWAGEKLDFSKDYCIWGIELEDVETDMNNNEISRTYNATISVYTNDSIKVDTFSDRVIEFLNGKSYGEIYSIKYNPPQQRFINIKPNESKYISDLEFILKT